VGRRTSVGARAYIFLLQFVENSGSLTAVVAVIVYNIFFSMARHEEYNPSAKRKEYTNAVSTIQRWNRSI
jgi:hypothetical protein